MIQAAGAQYKSGGKLLNPTSGLMILGWANPVARVSDSVGRSKWAIIRLGCTYDTFIRLGKVRQVTQPNFSLVD